MPSLSHEAPVTNLWFDAPGRYLAIATKDNALHVWDPRRGVEVARLSHDEEPKTVQFDRVGRRLVTRAGDRDVHVWEIASGREIARRTHAGPVRIVAISHDGSKVASETGTTVTIWDAATGRDIGQPLSRPGETVTLAFSPDGCCLAIGGGDGLLVRDIGAGHDVLSMPFAAVVARVFFSPSGERLAVATRVINPLAPGDAVHVFPWRPADLMASACSRLRHNLLIAEWEERIGGNYEATCRDAPEHAYEMMIQGLYFDRMGDSRHSSIAFTEAVSAALNRSDPELANSICWNGSLAGFAKVVLPACDRAVSLSSGSLHTASRDSRGVARAIVGDRRGALEDLEAGLEWFRTTRAPAETMAQRQSWLAALRGGRNPFDDPSTLAALKKAEAAPPAGPPR